MNRVVHISARIFTWSIIVPVIAWLILWGAQVGIKESLGNTYLLVMAVALVGAVLAAVHHAEIVAHKVGEPFGTLLLAIAITVIEVALILSLMLASGTETATLARDTVFASVMIILSGIVGLCLLIGGVLYKEQVFQLHGANATLTTLAAIVVLTLILPNYTTSSFGPMYSAGQLTFIALVSFALYGTFIFVQVIRHRNYFLDTDEADIYAKNNNKNDASIEVMLTPTINTKVTFLSVALLLLSLVVVVLLAKSLAPSIEALVISIGAPNQLAGVIVASIVMLPEGLAAVRAARKNHFQTSLNLALGSALATVGLTIPVVAILSLIMGWTLVVGIDAKSIVLLLLALSVNALSLATGRTNVLQGVILLVIFAVYLFTTIIP